MQKREIMQSTVAGFDGSERSRSETETETELVEGLEREGCTDGRGKVRGTARRVVFARRLIRRETPTPPSSRGLNYRATKQDFEVETR